LGTVTIRRWRARLVAQLALLTLAISAALGVTAALLVRGAFEAQLEERVSHRLDELARAVRERGEESTEALARLDVYLRHQEPALLERLLRGDPAERRTAARLMSIFGLTRLDLVDADGRLVSSAHASAEFGLPRDGLANLAQDEPSLVVDTAGTIDWLTRHTMRLGDIRLDLVGGLSLGQRFLERVAGGDAAALVADGRTRVTTDMLDGVSWDDRVGEAEDGAIRIRGKEGSGWSIATRALPVRTGASGVTLVAAVDRGPIERVLSRAGTVFLGVALAATSLAALGGAWVGRSVARPVNQLIRSVDAVAAGQADYTFDRPQRDEFEELVAAFSRLHRSLEFQRERSRAAERVAAWREVARRVAHEVKNPLAPIRLTVENLRRARRVAPERFDELFDAGAGTILEEVDRLKRLVGEFSDFARLPLPVRRPTDVNGLIADAVRLYDAEPGITIRRRDARPLPSLDLDGDQISRALGNILRNAVEATRSNPERNGDGEIAVTTDVEETFVRIEISDQGPGLGEEGSEQIFEPYFTTKAKGTGLGMSITYRIITEHGGLITAEDVAGGGARVVMRLPRNRSQ
jgi:signal transduction histidine kinase